MVRGLLDLSSSTCPVDFYHHFRHSSCTSSIVTTSVRVGPMLHLSNDASTEDDAPPMHIIKAVQCAFSDGCVGAGRLGDSLPVGNC
jgi:hypothetical protein